MGYLISVLLAAASVVSLLVVLRRLMPSARRLIGTLHSSRTHVVDRTGLLAARIAALRVTLERRRHRRNGARSHPTPSA